MQYVSLGRTGVKVSPLCLGAMMFGAWGNTDRKACVEVIHRALDEGINFIDTANIYSEGESEEIVGEAIRERRDEVVLATKVWGPMGEGPNQRGLSRKHITQSVEASLRRLGTDVIDLYQIHRPDPETPWEETLRALDDLVRQGKVRYLGCSTSHLRDDQLWTQVLEPWELVETFWICDRLGLDRFVCLQPPYSLLRRTMETTHFPASLRYGVANIVWSPLEGGFLSGKYRRGGALPESPRAARWVEDLENPRFTKRLDVIEELAPYVEAKGCMMAEFALAWSLRHPAVTSSIIGPRTMEQLESCLAALAVEITDEDAAFVDGLVPPGTSAL